MNFEGFDDRYLFKGQRSDVNKFWVNYHANELVRFWRNHNWGHFNQTLIYHIYKGN